MDTKTKTGNQKQPTTLAGLRGLIDRLNTREDVCRTTEEREKDYVDVVLWLEWVQNFLESRSLYHKKQHIKKAMMIKMAKTLLAPDEIERVEAEAEEQAAAELDKEGV